MPLCHCTPEATKIHRLHDELWLRLARATLRVRLHAQLCGADLALELHHPQSGHCARSAAARKAAGRTQRTPLRPSSSLRSAVPHEPRALRTLRALLGPEVNEQMAAGGEPLGDAVLRRWLRARRSPEAAAAALTAQAAWRAAAMPAGRVLEARASLSLFPHACLRRALSGGTSFRGVERALSTQRPLVVVCISRLLPALLSPCSTQEDVQHELAAGKAFLQGADATGRPVLVVMAARHDMGARDLAETRRFVCYVLDAAAAVADAAGAARGRDPNGLLCLFDLSGGPG